MTLKCPQCLHDSVIRKGYCSDTGKQRFKCKACGHRTVAPLGINYDDPAIDRTTVSEKVKQSKKKRKWLITSAQNATPVFQPALDACMTWCSHNEGELIVIPNRYKNPTSLFTDKDHDWWHPSLVPSLVDQRVELCKGLVLLADIKVVPTAKNPLTGMEGFTGDKSCIVGHPHYQFHTVATRAGDLAKIMTTTGSITLPNYTNSKAGKIGDHHHSLGAVVVEWDGECFHIRKVGFENDGSFIDWDKRYTIGGVEDAPRPKSLVLGDLHQWWVSKDADSCTFDFLIPNLSPEKVVLHDVLDSYSISHHARNDPFIRWAKHHFNKGNIRTEIEDLAEFLGERILKDIEYFIIPSNHDDHVTRFIKEVDWRTDLENAEFYLETALHMLRGTKMVDGGSSTPRPFDYWMNKLLPEISILDRDKSFMVGDVEHSFHGDVGPNGARGSAKNLSRVGVKTTIGHGHSPCVVDACYQVGVMAPDMVYASGPSGWMVSHVLQYANDKRTHVHIIKGKCKA